MIVSVALVISTLLLGVALVLSLLRVFGGPSVSDRVLAVDMISYVAIGFAAILAFSMRQPVLLDAAAVLAVVAFVGTLALARHVERTQGSEKGGGAS